VVIVALCLFTTKGTEGIRFSIDKEECLSHKVEYEGDTVHVSFVVIKANSLWHYDKEGVDLVVCISYLNYCFYCICDCLHDSCAFRLFW
jgi:hypothetical protein